MFDALPEGPAVPESEARSPVPPPVQGTAPTWDSTKDIPPVEPASELPPSAVENTSEPSSERSAMTDTAERIGSAVGNAQRQWRRGLQLVRRSGRPLDATTSNEESAPGKQEDLILSAEPRIHTSRVLDSEDLKEIAEEVTNARRQAAQRLEELSKIAEDRFQQFRRRARVALLSSRSRAKELADAYPLQTIAAVAGASFVLGMALRFRRSHRG